ncbi:MAG: hypothetical protein II940_03580 [Methanosarcinaceae archaeon]|nr:hypothetical protein [Methanosarcinaceae archaeon]
MTAGKKEQIGAFIEKLSHGLISDEYELKAFLKETTAVYQNDPRHSYADIFDIVFPLFNDPDRKGDVDVIISNLDMIIDKLSVSDQILAGKTEMLRDHINLELRRYTAYSQLTLMNDTGDFLFKGKLDEIESRVRKFDEISDYSEEFQMKIDNAAAELQKRIDDVSAEQKKRSDAASAELKKRIDKISSSSLTTLSIFAGIVIAFTGAVSFESDILGNLKDTDLSTIGFSISLTGLVFFNALVLLLHFIAVSSDTEKKTHAWSFVIGVNALLIAVFCSSVISVI